MLIRIIGWELPNKNSKFKRKYGIYICPYCGSEFRANYHHIQSGHTRSCGCIQADIAGNRLKTHGLRDTLLYGVWGNIKNRCYNPNDEFFYMYGGSGISLCDEWRNDFQSFYDWCMEHGYKKGLKIDRINNDGNYEPNNCRWVDDFISAQNKKPLSRVNTSGYRCVFFHKYTKLWFSTIRNHNKINFLGYYHTKEEAAIAYNKFVIENKTNHPLNIIT